jgi:hypothetical protein
MLMAALVALLDAGQKARESFRRLVRLSGFGSRVEMQDGGSCFRRANRFLAISSRCDR